MVGDHVTLRPAGGGSLKGLCPFHEERSPSFHVTPAKGLYHCFGCQVGGDVIDFLERIEHLTFQEAVEKLAARFGIKLQYEESAPGRGVHRVSAPDCSRRTGPRPPSTPSSWAAQKPSSDAASSTSAGSTRTPPRHFGVGFAPNSWDALTRHLRSKGFTDRELHRRRTGERGAARSASTDSADAWCGRSATSPATSSGSAPANCSTTTKVRST